MAIIERDIVLQGKDENGNGTIDLPITRLGNIEDTADTKTAPVAQDYIPVIDSADSGQMKKATIASLVDTVQKHFIFDTIPTENSVNPVTSGGIYNSIRLIGAALVREVMEESGTWSPPEDMTVPKVRVLMAGGGGGGAEGGGGGGGYVIDETVEIDPDSTYAIVIGAGGAASSDGGSGGDGSPSKFGTILTAQGGSGATAESGGSGYSGGGGGGGSLGPGGNGSKGPSSDLVATPGVYGGGGGGGYSRAPGGDGVVMLFYYVNREE